MKKILNLICVIFGFLSLIIALVGVIVPILPTTPFLILAALLFAKGSTRFHKRLLSSKLYKKHVEIWMKTKKMSKQEKVKILLLLFLLFGAAIYFVPIWHAKVFLGCIAFFHFYYFLFRIKTESREVQKKEREWVDENNNK